MTPDVLKQRHGFTVRSYALTGDAVEVSQRSLLRRSSWRIPYVALTNEQFESTVYSRVWLWLTVISVALCVVIVVAEIMGGDTEGLSALALYGVFALLFGALFWQSREHVIGFQAGNTPLWLGAHNPSTARVDEFLANLQQRRLTFLREGLVVQPTGGTIADELQKLLWLKEQGAISEDEFDSLKREALGSSGEAKKPATFLH